MNWQQFWQKKSFGNWLLLPLSVVFYVLTASRRVAYRYGLLAAKQASLPVVVIGNINVGGAGKTPLVIALANLLAEHGIRCAVISKGYGGSYEHATMVEATHCADVVGDEPLLIKLKCDCPVVVAKSRIEAANLVVKKCPNVQIILTDDGLQHYQLQRDMEICVINARIGLGNGWLLPAGGLREPPSRLNQVDFVVQNMTTEDNIKQGYYYTLTDRGWYHINSGKKRYHDEFSDDKSGNLALSGIAHPYLFFQQLETLGIVAKTRPLADHYAITAKDLPRDKTLLMTEKDWVKAKAFRHHDAWYLAVDAVLSESLKKDFLQQVKQIQSCE